MAEGLYSNVYPALAKRISGFYEKLVPGHLAYDAEARAVRPIS